MQSSDPALALANLLVLVVLLGVPLYWMLGKSAGLKVIGRGLALLAKLLGASFAWIFNTVRDSGAGRLSTLAGAAAGVLAPGDCPPHPHRHRDYLDYRGCATRRELRGLECDGIPLGRFRHPRGAPGAPLCLPPDLLQRGCAIIGPSGSGKTVGLVIPWIVELLRLGASVVTCDVKGDLIERLRPEAARLGVRLWYWNSGDAARSRSWNWLAELQDQRDYEAATQSILGRPRPGDSQPFFYERDLRWLRTLIAVVKEAYGDAALPRYLYALVADQTALRGIFAQCPRVRHHATELADLFQFSPDEHSRAVSGLLNALHLFKLPAVVAVTERREISLAQIADTPTLLVVGASLADAKLGEVMSALALNQLFNVVYRRFTASAATTHAPLYFIIDEAPRLKDRIPYEEVLSVVRSARAGVCLAAQDVNQFGDQRQHNAILANCATLITLRGSSVDTARYLSSRLGQRSDQSYVLTRYRGPFDLLSQRGSNAQMTTAPVLGEREIMHPPGGAYCALAQVAPISPKPFLLDLYRTIQS